MLKWKRVSSGTLLENYETLADALAGMAGKNRVIKKISTFPTDDIYLRVYRDAEQIVDFDFYALTLQAPFIEMDLPLAEGQLCSVGFYNSSTELAAIDIMIGYEESD